MVTFAQRLFDATDGILQTGTEHFDGVLRVAFEIDDTMHHR